MTDTPRYWHRPSPIAWIGVVCMAALMLGLGLWQLQRLEQKEALLAAIAAQQKTPPSTTLPDTQADWQALGFGRFLVRGEFLHAQEKHLAARYFRGTLGYHVLTPLRLEDGRLLLVNRGWIPTQKKDPASRPETLPEGPQEMVVMLRTDRDHTPFTPEHDVPDNIWFWRDIPRMRETSGLDLLPVSADVVQEKPDRAVLPIPSDGTFALRNDHLGYAVTWFLVGLSGIVIFFFYHYRR